MSTRTVLTACTYDCPDACSLRVSVDAEGRVSHIRGDPEHPVTGGFACYRVHRHARLLRHPDRLTTPLRRQGDSFQPIPWDEALDLCARKLGSTLDGPGPEAVLHIGGGGSLALSKELVGHFFRSLGPVTTVRGGVCGEAGSAAQYADFGDSACHDYTDLRHSAAIVLWGKNAVASGVHLVPFIHAARDRGAPVWVINPCTSESHRLAMADHVVCPAPGSDGWLALAAVRRLHERGALRDGHRVENLDAVEGLLRGLDVEQCARRCDVPLEQIDALAGVYSGRPVATWIGWGLQRSAAGGHAVRCIDALCLLSGQVGVRGGGANFSSGRSRGLDRSMLAGGGQGRAVGAALLGRDIAALDGPPIRFVYIACANPVTQHADSDACRRALEDPDRFVVVADAFLTDTARAADLVLPVALMLEDGRDVVGSYQHHHVARVERVVEPPAGVRTDLQIVQELSSRLGRPRDAVLDDPVATVNRMTAAWFTDAAVGWARNPAQPEVPYVERFATPSGKARLVTEPPADPPDPGSGDLLFLTVSSRRWQTSQLPEDEQQGPAECFVSPVAAGRAGVEAGQRAQLRSSLGTMEVVVRLSEAIHPSACMVNRGGWVCRGRGVNLLVEGRETDLGQGTAFYSQRVRLEPTGP
jgi:anaerobic selenocysteine-containing dehydrogenase